MARNNAKSKATNSADKDDMNGRRKHTKYSVPMAPLRRSPRFREPHFRFMDLPQELRDMVYHELWKDTPAMVIPVRKSQWVRLYYGDYGRTPYGEHRWEERVVGLPCWLLANKAILDEGITQLLTIASWRWARGSVPSDHHSKTSPLVNLSVATNLSVVKLLLYTARGSTRLELDPTRRSVLQALPNFLQSLSSQLRVLNLETVFIIPNPHTHPNFNSRAKEPFGSWTADPFSSLRIDRVNASMVQLEELNVRLEVRDKKAEFSVDPNALAKPFRSAFEAEVTRLGNLFVGEGGRLEVRETPSREGIDWNMGSYMDATALILDFKFSKA